MNKRGFFSVSWPFIDIHLYKRLNFKIFQNSLKIYLFGETSFKKSAQQE